MEEVEPEENEVVGEEANVVETHEVETKDIEIHEDEIRMIENNDLEIRGIEVNIEKQSDSQNDRLIINKIEMENFKSYSGVKVVGPFHKCFNSIVGPNGSGKSNVIDALLFVFGRRGKTLRLNKLSELIHNSDGSSNYNSARVSVYFESIREDVGDKDYVIIPNSQFTITRTINRQSISKYFINDKVYTFNEIAEFLINKGIDLNNNRFLILQGEVEQISLMKPKSENGVEEGLLEYLEDIIGSNKYIEEINKTSQLLDTLNSQRTQALDRVKLAEKERDNIEASKNQAELFINRKMALLTKEYIIQYLNMKEIESSKLQVEEKVSKLVEELNLIKSQVTSQESQLSEFKKIHTDTQQRYDTKQKELITYKTEFAQFEKKDIQLREQLKNDKNKKREYKKTLSENQTNLEKSKLILETVDKEIPILEDEVKSLDSQKIIVQDQLDVIYRSKQSQTTPLQHQIDELEGKKSEITQEQNQLKSKQKEKQVLGDNIRAQVNNNKQLYDNLSIQLSSINNNINEFNNTKTRLETHFNDIDQRYNDLINQQRSCKLQEQQYFDQLQQSKALLQQMNQSVSQNQQTSTIYRKIDDSIRNGSLQVPGQVYGRLGDLGTIDSKYDVAITTACPSLNNIVVQTTEDAQQCIAFLKQYKLGRMTFIILDKIAGPRQKRSDIPTHIDRLYDLVNTKPEFHSAFYFALRDTLVIEDLDKAVKVAYVRGKPVFRVVTLNGQLVDSNGTLSGGGNIVRSGGMKSNNEYSQSEIDNVQKEIKTLEDQYKSIKQRIVQLDSNIEELDRQKTGLHIQMSKNEKDYEISLNDKPNIETQLSVMSTQLTLSPEQQTLCDQYQSSIASLEIDVVKCNAQINEYNNKISNIKKQINEIGGKEMVDLQNNLKDIQTNLDKKYKKLSSHKSSKNSSTKQISHLSKDINTLDEKINKLTLNIEQIKKELEDMVPKATVLLETFQRSEREVKELEVELNDIKSKYDGVIHEINTLENTKLDITNKRDEAKDQLKQTQINYDQRIKKMRNIEDEYKHLKKDLFIGDEIPNTSDIPLIPDEDHMNSNHYTQKEVQMECVILQEQVDSLKDTVNLESITLYREKAQHYEQRIKELEHLSEERNTVRNRYEELRKNRLHDFMNGFTSITLKLKEIYQMITLGGDAELELVDSLDPFSEGVEFSVRPPRKSWKNIINLSGGEKTLSSLALVFALHHYKPTALYVMDEIDAALDFRNVSIVGNYIKERTKNAQFIIISLRNNMFELSDRLIGIYKTNNDTKSVTIDPDKVKLSL